MINVIIFFRKKVLNIYFVYSSHLDYCTGWKDKIVALEKTT